MNINDIITESHQACPHCGGPLVEYSGLMEKKDACYYKVKASAKVWPSAYASGRLVQCRKKGAANYGNKSEGVVEGLDDTVRFEVDSENAYNHVMDQFGSVIDWDGDTMVAPRKYWGAIQELAYAANGEASEEHGLAEGSAADGSVNYTLGHTPDAEYVYSIYRDGKKEGTYHSVDQAREIMGNMKLTSPNREYKIKRGARNKMAGPASQLPEQGVAEGSGDAASATPAKNERGKYTAWDDDEPMRLKCEDGEFRTIQEINVLRQKIGMKPFSIKSQQGVAEAQLDEKCWDGYQQQGMKNKGGRQVPNCVPTESVEETMATFSARTSTRNSGSGEFRGVSIPSDMKHPEWREPTWSFQEIAQKLGIPVSTLNLIAFNRIGGFPEALPGLSARHGSKKYYKQSEVKRWVNANNVREKLKQGVAEDLNEFAPGGGGDDDIGNDPYKYPKPESYRRSADYFGQFEADHFDREDFDDDTGVFKGYWGSKQIAYFKFDNPARTGSDDPGRGWYYEPQSGGSDDTTAAPASDNADERKQQELGMIRQFLKSGNRPSPGSQIYNLMKRHGIEEDLSRRGFLRGLGAAAAGAVGVGAAGPAQARSTDASRKEDAEALALLAKGMTPEQVAKKLGVAGPNHGQTHHMGGRWASINRAAAQLRRQRGLNEFAMGGGDDDGNDGFSDDTLKQLAAQWYNGDEDPRVESTLAAAGWEIGQDEGYDDTPGVFVVQAGDINGNSYISWPAHELEGLDEAVDPEIEEMYEAMEQLAEEMAARKGVSVDLVWESFEALDDHMLYETAAWRRKEGKSKKGGLNAKGVASYRRENPGSKLQMAVTTKPSKLKKGSKASKRRKSFCARMGGVKGPMKKPNGKPTRKALALRKWNC